MNLSENNKKSSPHTYRTGAVLLAVLLLLSNVCLCFLLEPYRSSSAQMWELYRQQPELDMVILGTSQGLSGIRPDILRETAGMTAFNMSTNMQSFAASKDALETAVQDHGIRTAVLVIDQEMTGTGRRENLRAEASYWRGKEMICGPFRKLQCAAAFVTDPAVRQTPYSLTYFAPWTYNRSADILLNIREKLAGRRLEEEGQRDEYGYEPSDEIADQDIPYVFVSDAAAWSSDHPELDHLSITPENEALLREICQVCSRKDVELVPILIPYLNGFNIYDYESYLQTDGQLASLFAEYGFVFRDYNLILQEQGEEEGTPFGEHLTTMDFKDVGHLNRSGAEKFTRYFGNCLVRGLDAPQ